MRFSFGFTDLMQRSDVLRWLAGLQQRHNAVLVIGINRRKWCLRRWMWSLSLASRDMATDSQPSHSQPAPISARYPVADAKGSVSQAHGKAGLRQGSIAGPGLEQQAPGIVAPVAEKVRYVPALARLQASSRKRQVQDLPCTAGRHASCGASRR